MKNVSLILVVLGLAFSCTQITETKSNEKSSAMDSKKCECSSLTCSCEASECGAFDKTQCSCNLLGCSCSCDGKSVGQVTMNDVQIEFSKGLENLLNQLDSEESIALAGNLTSKREAVAEKNMTQYQELHEMSQGLYDNLAATEKSAIESYALEHVEK